MRGHRAMKIASLTKVRNKKDKQARHEFVVENCRSCPTFLRSVSTHLWIRLPAWLLLHDPCRIVGIG